MVKLKSGPAASGPSSAIGIMRFFDTDTKGPKLSPEFIIGITFVFIMVIVFLKFFL